MIEVNVLGGSVHLGNMFSLYACGVGFEGILIGMRWPKKKGIFRGSLMSERETWLTKSGALLRHKVEKIACCTIWLL